MTSIELIRIIVNKLIYLQKNGFDRGFRSINIHTSIRFLSSSLRSSVHISTRQRLFDSPQYNLIIGYNIDGYIKITRNNKTYILSYDEIDNDELYLILKTSKSLSTERLSEHFPDLFDSSINISNILDGFINHNKEEEL